MSSYLADCALTANAVPDVDHPKRKTRVYRYKRPDASTGKNLKKRQDKHRLAETPAEMAATEDKMADLSIGTKFENVYVEGGVLHKVPEGSCDELAPNVKILIEELEKHHEAHSGREQERMEARINEIQHKRAYVAANVPNGPAGKLKGMARTFVAGVLGYAATSNGDLRKKPEVVKCCSELIDKNVFSQHNGETGDVLPAYTLQIIKNGVMTETFGEGWESILASTT